MLLGALEGAREALLSGVREGMGSAAKLYFGTFPSEVRPEHVTHAALALVKRFASNTQLVIGGQSGSDRVLESAHRGHTREDVLRAVRELADLGARVHAHTFMPLPGTPIARSLARARARKVRCGAD